MPSKTDAGTTQAGVTRASDHDISDGYIYLFGRLTVTRQQPLDFQQGGYSLTFRFYGPRGGVADGSYYPPPLIGGS